MLPRWLRSSRYSRLSSNPEETSGDENDLEKSDFTWFPKLHHKHIAEPKLSFYVLVSLALAIALTAGCLGFGVGAFVFRDQVAPSQALNVAPQVSIGHSVQTFQYNRSFAAPPSAQGGSEGFWDSLIPNGLGYVRNDPLVGSNLSVISVFHQLHCLYTLRRAYYSNSTGGEAFDFGLDRKRHVKHCFEYLRQGLICSADSTVEPAEQEDGEFLGWGFQRQCRNYKALKEWAETWRAFDGYGFLARPTHRHD